MAIFSFSMEPVARSSGRSAAAAAAYVLGAKIENPRDGMVHDYGPKARAGGVVHTYTVLADGSQVDPQKLWHDVELHHKRGDAVPARTVMGALPHELSPGQNAVLMREVARSIAEEYGVAVSAALHAPDKGGDQRNWHAHFAITACSATPEPGGYKLGNKVKALDPIACKRAGVENAADKWRERWEKMVNAALEKAGSEARVDHRSLFAQREAALAAGEAAKAANLDRAPGEHLGVKAVAMERKNPEFVSGRRKNIEQRQRDFEANKAGAKDLDRSIEIAEKQLAADKAAKAATPQRDRAAGLATKERIRQRKAAENAAAGKPANGAGKAPAQPSGASTRKPGTHGPSQTPARSTARPAKAAPGPSVRMPKNSGAEYAGLPKHVRDMLRENEKLFEALRKWFDSMGERLRALADRNAAAKKAAAPKKPVVVKVATKPPAVRPPAPQPEPKLTPAAKPAQTLEVKSGRTGPDQRDAARNPAGGDFSKPGQRSAGRVAAVHAQPGDRAGTHGLEAGALAQLQRRMQHVSFGHVESFGRQAPRALREDVQRDLRLGRTAGAGDHGLQRPGASAPAAAAVTPTPAKPAPVKPVARPVDPERAARAAAAKAAIGKAPAEPQRDELAERREASRRVQEQMERQRAERLEAQRLAREKTEADRRTAEQRRDEEIRDDREADRRDEDREHDALRKEIEHKLASKGISRSTAVERYAEAGDWKSVERMIDEGAHVKGKAMDAAAKAGKDDTFQKMVSSRMSNVSDASDLKDVSKELLSPEGRAKLEQMIANAKGSSLSDMGLSGPKAPTAGAKPSGPSMGSGPTMGGR